MKEIKRILVAVKDPGARAQPAIVKAAQIARACGARLELFHADCRSDYLRALTTKSSDARMPLTPICQCPRVCHPPSFWTAGHPVDTLPRLSRSIHAAILVLGAVSRALIGSTTRYLLDSVS